MAPSPAPAPPWYLGNWSLRTAAGTTTSSGGSSAEGLELVGSVLIDDVGRVTGELERTSQEPGAPLAVRGTLQGEALRFEAASLTERALVITERPQAEPRARFVGSLTWASVDGAASGRSSVELTPAARSGPGPRGDGEGRGHP